MVTEWTYKKIKDIAPLQRGFDLPQSTLQRGHIPVVFSNGINAYHNKAMVKGPGVVTGRSGTIGKLHYINGDFWPHNTTLWVTNFCGNNPLFVYYLFHLVDWNNYMSGSGVPTLNRNDVHEKIVYFPTDEGEQTTIATALSDTDALIDSLEKLIAKKQAIKQGAMQELLTGRRRLKGFSGEWKCYLLGEIGTFYKGAGISKSDVGSGRIACIRYGELYTDYGPYMTKVFSRISSAIAKQSVKLQYGDIVFAGSGETHDEIGKCTAYVLDEPLYAGGDTIVFHLRAECDSIFLGYCLNMPLVNQQKSQMGQGDAVVHISAKSLEKIEITIPDYKEQQAIAQILTDMDDEISAMQKKLDKVRRIKQGMMAELLTGRIRLN